MPIEIARCLVARGGYLKSDITIHSSENINGADYVKLSKSSWCTTRLLRGDGVSGRRQLAKTTILETLAKLRNDLYTNTVADIMRGDKEDLGLDVPLKRRRLEEPENMPLTGEIRAPSIDVFVDHRIRVRLNKSGPLWVELTPESLEYLHTAVTAQFSDELQKVKTDDIQQAIETQLKGIKGLPVSSARKSIRAYTMSNGKTVTKYFKISTETAAAEQVATAVAWLAGQS